MPRDFGRLMIEKLIVHDVPSRRVGEDGPLPSLSEVESTLTAPVRNYIRDKLVATLTRNSFPVVFKEETESPTPSIVFDRLEAQNQDFVESSRRLANYLYESQNGNNPNGLLAVVQTSIESIKSLAVVKLEREAGTRVQAVQINGKQTFDLEHLQDLMLTEKTRVFKVGFFIQEGTTLSSIAGFVSDNQSGQSPRGEVADFFLNRFLGCRLREDPEVLTRNFLDATEEWINISVPDPAKKTRYQTAAIAELQRNRATINPNDFAIDYLEREDRQSYIDHLQDFDVPANEFPKNLRFIESRLRRIQMELESGLTVTGRSDVFSEHVQMKPLDDGRTHIEITDRVKNLKSRG